MTPLTVDVDLPRDLLAAMDVSEAGLPRRVKELLALELFREGKISSGKAAELAGMTKSAFVQLLSRHGLAYFSEDAQELAREVCAAETILEGANR